jgi:hypothetical protein
MSVPLRKDDFVEEDLTTADLAQGKRSVPVDDRTSEGVARPGSDRPKPVLAERSPVETTRSAASEANVSEVKASGPSAGELGISPGPAGSSDAAPLFPGKELEELRNRWSGIQTAFVDEPRRAVEQADGLVASAMKRLAEVFAEERGKLEHQWDRGDNVSTEDLRLALQRYRSFFHRLLSV